MASVLKKIIPKGFELIERDGNFNQMVAPLYWNKEVEPMELLFFPEPKHENIGGSIHGGILMTAADHLMGLRILYSPAAPERFVTIQMNCFFLNRAISEEWIYVKPKIINWTQSLIFMESTFYQKKEAIFKAEGIWKIMPHSKKSIAQMYISKIKKENSKS